MKTPGDSFALDHMGDALAAAALVAAIVAAFFTLWQADVQKAIDHTPSVDGGNWAASRKQFRSALLTRAGPLSLIAIATFIILSPRAWKIAAHALRCGRACEYDDVQAMFVLTDTLILALGAVVTTQFATLFCRLIKYRSDKFPWLWSPK